MKKILYFLIIINVVSGVIAGIMLIRYSLITAAIAFVGAGFGVVPLIMIINNTDDIESLRAEVTWLREQLQKAKKNTGADDNKRRYGIERAEEKWQCIKCKAVNKAGTNVCVSCGEYYSSKNNPPNKYRETVI